MGFAEVLTVVFIVLKLVGRIEWSWFLVLLPEIIAMVIYFAVVIPALIIKRKITKTIVNTFKDFD